MDSVRGTVVATGVFRHAVRVQLARSVENFTEVYFL
jgi:hypothetical protein